MSKPTGGSTLEPVVSPRFQATGPALASAEVYFPLWLELVGHFGLWAKGGRHVLQENGTRSRHDRNGLTPNLSSRHDAWQAVIAFQEVIKKRLRRRIFIVPVICGTTDLAPRLVALGKTRKHLMTPPTAGEIAEEVGLFTPGPVPAAPALVMPADVPEPEYSYRTDQLVVQHADVINVYHNHPGTLPTR